MSAPITADGVEFTLGMTLWAMYEFSDAPRELQTSDKTHALKTERLAGAMRNLISCIDGNAWHDISSFYSSRDAAIDGQLALRREKIEALERERSYLTLSH